jgi:hypothetical protein
MIQKLKCLFGFHDLTPDFNARYDRCKHCTYRVRAV